MVEPVLLESNGPVDLVGHSHGASIALKLAIRHPARIRSVIAYEPTMFWLVRSQGRSQDVQGIVDAASDAAELVSRGEREAAARRFIDFWNGPGTWDRIPADRRSGPLQSIGFVSHWAHASLCDATPLSAFSTMTMPVLLMSGACSPLSGQAPAALLSTTIPDARLEIFEGLGHMAPLTHPEIINARIERFLDEVG